MGAASGSADGVVPNVFVIGAMKCASSSICGYLENHPDVYFLPGAEPNFFSHDENWARGLGYYKALFRDAGGRRLVGDGSNAYANIDHHPHAPARLFETSPQARLIYSVRHPVERIVSAWAQQRAQSPDKYAADINRAVREKPEWLLHASYYWRQVEAYRAYFGDDRIWIGFVEDLEKDREAYFRSLSDFLGVEYHAPETEDDLWRNKTSGRKILDARYNALRALPGMGALRRLAPQGAKDFVKERLKKPPQSKSELLDRLELPADALSALREDARALLAYAGKPADFWRL